MENLKELNVGDEVYIKQLKSKGFVINKGIDNVGVWYRTDSDGIRERHELKLIKSKSND